MPIKSLLFFLLLSAAFSSCSHPALWVRSRYLLPQDLASVYVGTPDPRKLSPPFGQQLSLNWSLPKEVLACQEVSLKLILRFRNREQVELLYPLSLPKGRIEYRLLNEEYCLQGGILTYRVELLADGELIEEWRHHLFAEWIELDVES